MHKLQANVAQSASAILQMKVRTLLISTYGMHQRAVQAQQERNIYIYRRFIA